MARSIFLFFIANLFFFCATTLSAQFTEDLEVLECFNDPMTFDGLNFFPTDDVTGNGVTWGSLESCGLNNYASGDGEALCANVSSPNTTPFETTINTNTVNLKGITSAALNFTLNYQDFDDLIGPGDRLELRARVDGGAWGNVSAWIFDRGSFNGVGINTIVNLGPWLDESDVQFQFRYYDNSGGNDKGHYVQIDDLFITCTGGADIVSTGTSTPDTVIAGEEVNISFAFTNNGPETATELNFGAEIAPGFTITSILPDTILVDNPLPLSENMVGFQLINPLPVGGSVAINATAIADLRPEVMFSVTSPSTIAGEYPAAGATIGEQLSTTTPISGVVVLVEDGVGDTRDGCEPITNTTVVANNIVLLEDESGCSADEQVLNAQKAGARAVMISAGGDDIFSVLFGLSELPKTILPSGNLSEPVTIPAIRIARDIAEDIELQIASGVNVEFLGKDVQSQEQISGSFSLAEEVDPDFSFFKIFTNGIEGTTNSERTTITVLKDSDLDGTPDINDQCRFDPNKTVPEACGCSNEEADLNTNGIADCLNAEEARFSLTNLLAAVKKLRRMINSLPKKKKANIRARKDAAKALLEEFISYYSAAPADFTSISSVDNIATLISRLEKKVKRALRIKSAQFGKRKKQAVRATKKVVNAVTA